jgi:hypothetical protein
VQQQWMSLWEQQLPTAGSLLARKGWRRRCDMSWEPLERLLGLPMKTNFSFNEATKA